MFSFSNNPNKKIPSGVKGWNWGAFFFTWIWGMFNNTWLAFAGLIPGIHIIVGFILGFKGNEWAWQNNEWDSVEQFHSVQRKWAIAAVSIFLVVTLVFIALPLGLLGWKASTEMPEINSIIADFKSPGRMYCGMAVSSARRNQRVQGMLGQNVHHRGRAHIAHNLKTGVTEVAMPVEGSTGNGTIYVRTRRKETTHQHQLVGAELESNGERVPLELGETGEEHVKNLQMEEAEHGREKWSKGDAERTKEAEVFYRDCLRRVEENGQVQETLGAQPAATVENATIDQYGPMGKAEFRVLLRGKGSEGVLDMKADKSMGRWHFDGAYLQFEGRQAPITFPAQD